MRLLIDADIFVYQTASSCEEAIDWGNDLWTLHSDLRHAKQQLKNRLDDLMSELDCSQVKDVTLCFSDSENWRKRENPSYKANRKDTRKPLAFRPLRDWVFENMNAVAWPYLEADDVLGILATDPKVGPCIVISTDKDLRTVPCTLFNPTKDVFPVTITEEEADSCLRMQTLTGDPVDGYPGLPGIGKVRAGKLLAEEDSWEQVLRAYIRAGFAEPRAEMVKQARMARILRFGDWDHSSRRMSWRPEVSTPSAG